ncbi:fimbria/pilus outer membrane usher protein, partial [Pantoea endophytica]
MLRLNKNKAWNRLAVELRWRLMMGWAAAGIIYAPHASAELYFDVSDINESSGNTANIDSFKYGTIPEGTYRVDVYVNQQYFLNQEIDFKNQAGLYGLQPVLTVKEWENMGARSPGLTAEKDKNTKLTDIGRYIPGAAAAFDYNHQKLVITIPQAFLNSRARNSIDPSRWDNGINAFLMSYNINASEGRQRDDDTQSDSLYVNLRPGINLGAWRLRNNSSYTRNVQKFDSVFSDRTRYVTDNWQSLSTYAQRDLVSLKSRLTLGESYTPGDVFESFTFTGVQLASDDNMLPDSLRGFAPVVRGVAATNAQVIVSQNGAIVYQTFVPPGPFALTDILPAANGGELNVSIKEADGSVKNFIQPFASIRGMQREGRVRFSATAGRYRSFYNGADKPAFTQGVAQYGFSNDITFFGGSIVAEKYLALNGGFAKSLGDFGSVSLDTTFASTTLKNDEKKKGQSYRLQYSKSIPDTGSVLSVAGYRYNTSGYYDFAERNQMNITNDDSWQWQYNKRSGLQVSLSQSLSDWGNLSASYYQQNYWNTEGIARTASL